MIWQLWVIFLFVGWGIGAIYGLIPVGSLTSPIVALLGLRGLRTGEAVMPWIRGHSNVVSNALHPESFAVIRGQGGGPRGFSNILQPLRTQAIRMSKPDAIPPRRVCEHWNDGQVWRSDALFPPGAKL